MASGYMLESGLAFRLEGHTSVKGTHHNQEVRLPCSNSKSNRASAAPLVNYNYILLYDEGVYSSIAQPRKCWHNEHVVCLSYIFCFVFTPCLTHRKIGSDG